MALRIFSLFVLLLSSSLVLAAPVSINDASAEQITNSLKGIGPSKAAAIIKYRSENGPFKTVDELTEIKGIGPKTIERNRVDIIINPANDMSS